MLSEIPHSLNFLILYVMVFLKALHCDVVYSIPDL